MPTIKIPSYFNSRDVYIDIGKALKNFHPGAFDFPIGKVRVPYAKIFQWTEGILSRHAPDYLLNGKLRPGRLPFFIEAMKKDPRLAIFQKPEEVLPQIPAQIRRTEIEKIEADLKEEQEVYAKSVQAPLIEEPIQKAPPETPSLPHGNVSSSGLPHFSASSTPRIETAQTMVSGKEGGTGDGTAATNKLSSTQAISSTQPSYSISASTRLEPLNSGLTKSSSLPSQIEEIPNTMSSVIEKKTQTLSKSSATSQPAARMQINTKTTGTKQPISSSRQNYSSRSSANPQPAKPLNPSAPTSGHLTDYSPPKIPFYKSIKFPSSLTNLFKNVGSKMSITFSRISARGLTTLATTGIGMVTGIGLSSMLGVSGVLGALTGGVLGFLGPTGIKAGLGGSILQTGGRMLDFGIRAGSNLSTISSRLPGRGFLGKSPVASIVKKRGCLPYLMGFSILGSFFGITFFASILASIGLGFFHFGNATTAGATPLSPPTTQTSGAPASTPRLPPTQQAGAIYGINLGSNNTDLIPKVADMVSCRSNGWIVFFATGLDQQLVQKAIDSAYKSGINLIIRLSNENFTGEGGNNWGELLNKATLNPGQIIYVVAGNEPNGELGQDEASARQSLTFLEALLNKVEQSKRNQIKIGNAPLAAWNESWRLYLSVWSQSDTMNRIDFWSSNDYLIPLMTGVSTLSEGPTVDNGSDQSYKEELNTIGKPNLPVIITESGLDPDPSRYGGEWNNDHRTQYFQNAYPRFKKDPRIIAVTPLNYINPERGPSGQHNPLLTSAGQTDGGKKFAELAGCSATGSTSGRNTNPITPSGEKNARIASAGEQIANQLLHSVNERQKIQSLGMICDIGTPNGAPNDHFQGYHCWVEMTEKKYDIASDPDYLQCTEFIIAAYDKAGFIDKINLITRGNARDWANNARRNGNYFDVFTDARDLAPGDIISLGETNVAGHLAIVVQKERNRIQVAQAATDAKFEYWYIDMSTGILNPEHPDYASRKMTQEGGFIRLKNFTN